MTKKDFELIADAVATVEADYKGLYRGVLEDVAEALADRIEREHPRFKRSLFERSCLPLKAAEHTAEVLHKLGLNGPQD